MQKKSVLTNIHQLSFFLTEPASWNQKVYLECYWDIIFWYFILKSQILKKKPFKRKTYFEVQVAVNSLYKHKPFSYLSAILHYIR